MLSVYNATRQSRHGKLRNLSPSVVQIVVGRTTTDPLLDRLCYLKQTPPKPPPPSCKYLPFFVSFLAVIRVGVCTKIGARFFPFQFRPRSEELGPKLRAKIAGRMKRQDGGEPFKLPRTMTRKDACVSHSIG